jgi:uncharacterized protein YecE (DUF72 family)
MQFGRSGNLDHVDFSLPGLTERSCGVLTRSGSGAELGSADDEWLRLGAPAFRHRDWLGTLYPADSNADDWLSLYAQKLSALELNSTFYGLPSEATIDRWLAQTPARFRFCPKLPRAISHDLGGAELQVLVDAFVARMTRLGPRLGPALIQLPERVEPAALPQLRAALAAFPDDFALALEVRHPGWFEAGALREELIAELEARAIASVITDVSGRRDASHASLTTARAFVRFVGEGGHASDEPRVAAWLIRLQAWRSLGLADAFFFVHQPDDIAAPQLLSIASEHARAAGVSVPSVALERPAVTQLDLFR